MRSVETFFESVLGVLFPDRCAACKALGSLLCARCQKQLVVYGDADVALTAVDHIQIAYVFQSPIREAIHALKYRRKRRMARLLGALLVPCIAQLAQRCDAVIPVPLHQERRKERGFNQAEELAMVVAQQSGLPSINDGLQRIRQTSQQARLDRRAREENMRGAFVWHHSRPVPRRAIVVDDVLTTGATINACAMALRDAGCVEIYGLAIARSRRNHG